MPGSLVIPTAFAGLSGAVAVSLLDTDLSTIASYVNAREITQGTFGARPAAGVAGRWYWATDMNGGTLYEDTGAVWTAFTNGLTPPLLATVDTPTTVANTAVETTVFSVSVPGGTLGIQQQIHVNLYGILSATGTPTVTIRLKYGGTTLATLNAYPVTNAIANHPYLIDADLLGIGATNAQLGRLGIVANDAGDNFGSITGTAAVDSTLAQTLAITFQWSTGNPADTYTMQHATARVLR